MKHLRSAPWRKEWARIGPQSFLVDAPRPGPLVQPSRPWPKVRDKLKGDV